jgi:hypothetical protein
MTSAITVSTPLYVRVIGDSWTQLAEPIRRVHATHSIIRASGRLHLTHGRRFLAGVLARLLRLPAPNAATQTQLIVTARNDGEHWQRTFNGRRFDTQQYQSNDGELAERYGVLEFRFGLDARGGSLLYVQHEAALMIGSVRLRIPPQWAPRVEAREDPAGPHSFNVNVRVVLPGSRLLIAYDGIIDVEDARG